MGRPRSLVCGVGINDANYVTLVRQDVGCVNGKRKREVVWNCPFYVKWRDMLQRCYSSKVHERYNTYVGCYVAEEWLTFSNFKKWMEKQDWEGKQLDKDILFPGNKEYGPSRCVFVSGEVNSFVLENNASRGEWPVGVNWRNSHNAFRATCRNPFTKKVEHLGYFDCPNEAHKAWLKRKQELAILLAAEQTDERVAKAIIDRYMNYGGTND